MKYREFLNGISHSVKLSYYCNMLGIDSSNLYKFLKGNNNVINVNKLELLVNYIKNDLSKLIENDA